MGHASDRPATPPPARQLHGGALALGLLAAAVLVGVGEGVHGIVEDGRDAVRDHAAGILGYAALSWGLPVAALLLVGSALAAALRGVRGPRLPAALVALGLLTSAMLWLEGAVIWLVAVGGVAVLVASVLLLRCLPWRLVRGAVAGATMLAALGVFGMPRLMGPVREPLEGATGGGRPNLILIVADTLRRDALSVHGGETPTPNLDAIGAGGWVVDDLISTSSWTLPAMTSLWSGRSPLRHGVRTPGSVVPDGLPMLAAHLKAAGYVTGAVISNPILEASRGFDRGFDRYEDDDHSVPLNLYWVLRYNRIGRRLGWIEGRSAGRKLVLPWFDLASGLTSRRTGYRGADEVTDSALEMLDEFGARRFFLHVHYFDPHEPYLPHPVGLWLREPALRRDNLERLKGLYRGEVAYLDRHVGRLMDELRRRGLLERSVVVFTSDHGEEFQDHGGWLHRVTLYDELVRLPLLVHFPAGIEVPPAPRTASLVDLAPTLLDLLDLPALPDVDGRSLLEPEEPRDRFADRLGEEEWWLALRRGSRHWIARMPVPAAGEIDAWRSALADPDGSLPPIPLQCYDVETDPAQKVDLAGQHPAEAAAVLRALLDHVVRHHEVSERPLSDRELERLRATGYLER